MVRGKVIFKYMNRGILLLTSYRSFDKKSQKAFFFFLCYEDNSIALSGFFYETNLFRNQKSTLAAHTRAILEVVSLKKPRSLMDTFDDINYNLKLQSLSARL